MFHCMVVTLQTVSANESSVEKNASITSGSSFKSSEMQSMNCGHLTVAELQVAEREIFKRVQQVAFPEVIDVLSATECCENKRYPKKVLKKACASIRQLNPQHKEGLLRVGGRLVNAPFGDGPLAFGILLSSHTSIM